MLLAAAAIETADQDDGDSQNDAARRQPTRGTTLAV
jgi:hypothetical protein